MKVKVTEFENDLSHVETWESWRTQSRIKFEVSYLHVMIAKISEPAIATSNRPSVEDAFSPL